MTWLSHGAAIHIPLALAILFPIFYAGCLISTRTGWLPVRIWRALLALGVLQVATLLLAYASGERARILSSGDPSVISRHEALAFWFTAVWIAALLPLLVSQITTHKALKLSAHVALVFLLFVQAALALWLGHLGGSLILH